MKLIKIHWLFILLICALLIGTWLINAHVSMPFSGALYWDYARHFQFGYLDSPYGLALVIKSYSLIFGTSALAYGYIKYLFFIISMIMVYFTANLLTNKKSALIAALMFLALPVQGKFFEHLNYHLCVTTAFTLVLYFFFAWRIKQRNIYLYCAAFFFRSITVSAI